MNRITVILLAVTGAARLGAQTPALARVGAAGHAEFTGTWILDLSSLDAGATAMVKRASLTLTHTAETLTMDASILTDEGARHALDVFHPGAGAYTDTVAEAGAPAERNSMTSSDGNTLVVTVKTVENGRPFQHTDRYSVDATGRVMTLDARVTVDGRESAFTQVYRRRT